jgi:hypothetical protein
MLPSMTDRTEYKQSADKVTVKVRGRGLRSYRVKFGSVTVSGAKPSSADVDANIERSTEALQRIGKKFGKPGVRLSVKKGVPRYSLDENDPAVFVRVLDGVTRRGRMVDGKFVALP